MFVTLRGWGLAVAGVALIAAGFLFGYPELAVLGGISLAAVAVALVHAAMRPELAVSRSVDPDRVSRGESSTVTLRVRNTGRFGATTLLAHDRCGWGRHSTAITRAGDHDRPATHDRRQRMPRETITRAGDHDRPATHDRRQRMPRETMVPVPLLRLRSGRETEVSYPVPTQRRGIIGVGPLQITRRDPLGLVSRTRGHGDTSTIWVYPKSHLMQAVPAGISRSLDGRLDRVPHGAITFDALREYVIGDELRHVHWRTSAKVGELMVREHVDTSLPRLAVLLDDREGSWPAYQGVTCEEFESACEAAASIVAAAMREDLPITLQLVSGAAASSGRIRGAARGLLDLMAEADPVPQGPEALVNVTNRLRQHRPGDTLIYLTGTGGHADLALVTGLKGPFPSVAIGMLGPRTPDEPDSVGVLMLRAEDGPEFASVWDGVTRW